MLWPFLRSRLQSPAAPAARPSHPAGAHGFWASRCLGPERPEASLLRFYLHRRLPFKTAAAQLKQKLFYGHEKAIICIVWEWPSTRTSSFPLSRE